MHACREHRAQRVVFHVAPTKSVLVVAMRLVISALWSVVGGGWWCCVKVGVARFVFGYNMGNCVFMLPVAVVVVVVEGVCERVCDMVACPAAANCAMLEDEYGCV